MVRQITLDGIRILGLSISLAGEQPRVEAAYEVLAGSEVIKVGSMDITDYITGAQRQAASNFVGDVKGIIEGVELG